MNRFARNLCLMDNFFVKKLYSEFQENQTEGLVGNKETDRRADVVPIYGVIFLTCNESLKVGIFLYCSYCACAA